MQEGIVSAGENEFPVTGRLTIGRTPDNTVAFPGDDKISRITLISNNEEMTSTLSIWAVRTAVS